MSTTPRSRLLTAFGAVFALVASLLFSSTSPAAAQPPHAKPGEVWELKLTGYTNHVHTSVNDNPPAQLGIRTVPVTASWLELTGAWHVNAFRHNVSRVVWASACQLTLQQFRTGRYNCVPGHSVAGATWVGHEDVPIYTTRTHTYTLTEFYIIPVNHPHPKYEWVCTNCGEDPRPTVPPTTTPPTPTTIPIPDRVPSDPGLVRVDFFDRGQTGGSLASEQLVTVSGATLTCDGRPAPCGAAPGQGASGHYGPVPVSLTVDSATLTAPDGFRAGDNPATADYRVLESPKLGADLWAKPQQWSLQFFRATPTNSPFHLEVQATATVRYIAWQCAPGLTECPDPAQRIELTTEEELPVRVTYRPHPDGTFHVVGATVAR